MSTGQANHRALLQRALATIDQMQARLDASARAQRQPIAIVGVGCRFPGGANTPEQFWDLLRQGRDAVTEVPADRWDVDAYYDPDPDAPGKSYTRWGAFLDRLDAFDPGFFGNAPREAIGMDPQHRLLLEVAWESLERAGYAPPSLAGSRTGVFVGLAAMDYAYLQMRHGDLADLDLYFGTGTSHSIAAGRLAYTFDFRGPAVAIDTACSSSLVAVHLACQSLRLGECDMAIGGGVNVMLGPEASVATSRGRMMSFVGRCHTFDAAADGYVRAEGCGLVVLKRLTDAIRDRDTIVGVIHGTALNQDGRSNGLTAPNPQAQEQVVRAALADAGMNPADIGYVEAHGTGTPLGDPIEMRALGAVFGASHDGERPLMVGSVKTNIGHLESAAGIAGLIKVLLALEHATIPPHLHLRTPNPYIPWSELPITVPTVPTPWPPSAAGTRVAGLSSFGFSGTNAHLIVGAPPASARPEQPVAERSAHVLAVSARSPGALQTLALAYEDRLAGAGAEEFADICYTAGAGRAHFPERLAVVASTADEARGQLAAFRSGAGAGVLRAAHHHADPRGFVFLFTGQGAQYAGMGRELYRTEPVFASALDRCAAIAEPLLDRPLLSVLFPETGAEALIDDTRYTQPALFAFEYALAQLWMSWGVHPVAVLGHSLGEYVAACVAGVFDVESAMKLVTLRARLMSALPRDGAMVAVMAPADVVTREIAGTGVAIAAVNGPAAVVISGREQDVVSAASRLAAAGVATRRLSVSHAFHSPLMEPMIAAFAEALRETAFTAPAIDLIANVSGEVAGAELLTPEYWLKQIRQPVQFAASMRTAVSLGHRSFLEVGPAPVLIGMGAQSAPADALWVASMRRDRDEARQLMSALATVFVNGGAVDWAAVDRPWHRRKVVLPTYPFERTRYWLALSRRGSDRATDGDRHPLLGARLRSPKLGGVVFQAELSRDTPSFVAEHLIFDRVVLPATAYFEMAVAAGTRVTGGDVSITDISIREPLVFGAEPHVVQTVLEPAGNDEYTLEIYSAGDGSDDWRLHVAGRIRRREADESVVDLAAPEGQPLDARAFYESLEPAGVCYGARFRLLDGIEVAGDYATARLLLPESERLADYAAHPAIVDASLQLAGAALLGRSPGQDDRPIYLPVAAGRYDVLGPVTGALRAVARVTPVSGSDETFIGDVTILSGEAPVVRVQGLSFKRATSEALRRAVSRADAAPLYSIVWEPAPPVKAEQASRVWLMLADAGGTAAAIAARLRAAGDDVTLVPPGGDEVRQLATALAEAGAVTDVVHCRSLDIPAPDGGDASFDVMRHLGATSLTATVQALAALPHLKPRLTIVTRAAVPAAISGEQVAPGQSAIWGLGRSVRNEHPSLQCKLVDLQPEAEDAPAMTSFVDELLDVDRAEAQIALRGGRRLAPRLVRAADDPSASPLLTLPDSPDFGLAISQRGVLDNLGLDALRVEPPQPSEIQIAVTASGLNFRDVLSALGMYPGEPGPLGGEVVGTVVAVGSDVRGFAVGDEVMALTPRGFCSRVNTSALLAWKRPAGMTAADAATIPVAFQTAYYALHVVASIRRGERVLIHAGAGGVGLAAIQIAQAAGAEIFATAGTPAKRDLLRRLGVPHVMDSRSLAFADEVRTATGGEGIDIVLNSLAGEFVPRSLALLRRGGRFVELGKTDLWDQARASVTNPNATYQAIYLGDLCISNPGLVHEMFGRIMAMFEGGVLRPLATRVFAIDEAQLAFRYMAQARHVGKVVVGHHRASEQPLVAADGAYLVTGGLGGVGLQVARWIAAAGARRVVLVGRRGPTAAVNAAIEAMRANGTEVLVAAADVSSRADVMRVVAAATAGDCRLRGIVHAAGVIDDGVVLQQNDERIARVYAPKVAGGWHLVEAARELDLDFVVFCSAGAALFGAPGQGNYAAANAFLDTLAWQARATGVPAISINWGAWRDTGMMAGVSARDQARWAAQGMGQLDPGAAIAGLEAALRRGAPQVAVLEIDWQRVAASGAATPFLARLTAAAGPAVREPRTAAPSAGAVRREIEALPAEDRLDHLASHVRDQVRRVLGLSDSAAIRPDRGFAQLGMDSLMSVELSNRLRESLGCQLPTTLAFEHPTAAALTEYLASHVLELNQAPAAAPSTVDESEAARVRLLEDVERLRDDEVERSLADELDRAGY